MKPIEHIIDYETRMLIHIIDLLADEEHWLETNELTVLLSLEKKTIRRYLSNIEFAITKYNFSADLKLHFKKGKGYFLEITQDQGRQALIINLIKDTLNYKIWYSIFFETFESVVSFAVKNQVSESTVRRKLKQIQDHLAAFDISLKRKSYVIVGKEHQIRLYSFLIWWNLFKGIEWPFDENLKTSVFQFVNYIESFFEIKLKPLDRKSLEYACAISLIRIRKRQFIQIEDGWQIYLKENTLHQSFLTYLNTEKRPLYLTEDELSFLFLMMQSREDVYKVDKHREYLELFHEKKQTPVYEGTRLLYKFIPFYFDLYQTQFSEDIHHYLIASHMFSSLFFKFDSDVNGYFFWSQLEEEFPLLNSKVSEMVSRLYEHTQNPIFQNQVFLRRRYLLAITELIRPSFYEKTIYVLLTTDLPMFEENCLREKILSKFLNKYNISMTTDTIWAIENSCDLIITTSNFPICHELDKKKRVLIEQDFTLSDIIHLNRELEQIVQEGHGICF